VVSERTRKILWVEAGGRCAICQRQLLAPGTETDDPSVFGEEAHIVARSPGGPRAGDIHPDRLDHHDNLILTCREHHKQIDDQPNHYTVDRLRQIKQAHNEWVASLGQDEAMDRTQRIGHAFVPREGGHYRLQLRNDGPGDLDRVEVELLNPAQPYESGLQAISDDDALGSTSSTTHSFGPWRLGETRRLGLWRNGAMHGVINLRCTCHLKGSKPWQVLLEAQPPPDA
jgi:hypothetical protein